MAAYYPDQHFLVQCLLTNPLTGPYSQISNKVNDDGKKSLVAVVRKFILPANP